MTTCSCLFRTRSKFTMLNGFSRSAQLSYETPKDGNRSTDPGLSDRQFKPDDVTTGTGFLVVPRWYSQVVPDQCYCPFHDWYGHFPAGSAGSRRIAPA